MGCQNSNKEILSFDSVDSIIIEYRGDLSIWKEN